MDPLFKLLLLGVLFHIIFAWSIFDIYFTSPLVHGMAPVRPPPPPATRLVLLVADGLRADKIYEDAMARAPFLKNVVEQKGSFGVSHTRVPTESRPGHVALIAGFYEDVSAVTKGWKTNPVDFDSVFNQSRHTWSFGSPDILPMFAFGATDPSRIEMFMYEGDSEDFAKDDASELDVWVFDKVKALFEQARTNVTLYNQLHQNEIVFFLHLLGLDTNGHAHRPYSKEYLNNIRSVDKGIAQLDGILNEFYGNDDKTAFIFTADHGMSNRGSHGDGDTQNTQTPLIAWGAGIQNPNKTHPTGHDDTSIPWKMNHVQRNDVNQADIAPLMSSLIGIAFPMNSVGKLPRAFLKNTDSYKALATFANAKQIHAKFLVKEALKKKGEIVFRPFIPLTDYHTIYHDIEFMISQGRFIEAEQNCISFIDLCQEGLNYYQTYDWLFLRSIVSLGYIGWIVFSSLHILRMHVFESEDLKLSLQKDDLQLTIIRVISSCITSSTLILLYVKNSPPTYYLYALFPLAFWTHIISQHRFIRFVLGTIQTHLWSTVLHVFVYACSLEMLVFSYFDRRVLTVWLILAGIIWPISMSLEFRTRHWSTVLAWVLSCFCTSVFTMLPVELEEDLPLICAGAFMIIVSGVLAIMMLPYIIKEGLPITKSTRKTSLTLTWVQIALVGVSTLLLIDTSKSLTAKQGLPVFNSIMSWTTLAASILIPIMSGLFDQQYFMHRILVIYLAFAPGFILLSVSYEALFYFFFSQSVFIWMLLEKQLYYFETKTFSDNQYHSILSKKARATTRSLVLRDLRIASFFMFFINTAFFGTGNLASVSSFSIESVYRFTTIFDPFLMGSLLIFKIFIPFFILSAVFGVLSRLINLPPFSLFLLVLSTTDITTLNFFFLVRDQGSWMQIGTSISHFVIASTFIVFQIILFTVSHFLVGNTIGLGIAVSDAVSKIKRN